MSQPSSSSLEPTFTSSETLEPEPSTKENPGTPQNDNPSDFPRPESDPGPASGSISSSHSAVQVPKSSTGARPGQARNSVELQGKERSKEGLRRGAMGEDRRVDSERRNDCDAGLESGGRGVTRVTDTQGNALHLFERCIDHNISFPLNLISSSPSSHPVFMHLDTILICPLCQKSLLHPTTLHCGHSICSGHQFSSCPVKNCPTVSPSPAATLNIPSSSTVQFHPAPPPDPAPQPETSDSPPSDHKLDVTLNKVITLTNRAQSWLQDEDENAGFIVSQQPQEDDTDDEQESPDHDRSPTRPPSPTRPSTLSRQRESSSSPQRPHKRRRRHASHPPPADDDEEDLLSHLRFQSHIRRFPVLTEHGALARFEKELLSELTCEICFMLLYQPVTTPCQHTFCSKCLHRSLDHSSSCPLCRHDLPGFSYFQDHPHNKVILAIVLKAFPAVYSDRGLAIEAEERDARLDTPIFVCQLSFPGMPTLLHFFEPRYRLMLRRCLESPNPRFGMIMPPRAAPAPTHDGEYGTMLEIRSVQMLHDGRSMVETYGTHRFRILERGTLDGYMVGRVERIDDYPEDLDEDNLDDGGSPTTAPAAQPTPSSSSSGSTSTPLLTRITTTLTSLPSPQDLPPRERTNDQLMDICHDFLEQLRHGAAPWVVQRLNNTIGPMPSDASSFPFWVALVLPIDEHEKAKLLPIRSPRLRLRLVVHWIEQLNNNWWFTAGCVVL